jgi:hypothetical protein
MVFQQLDVALADHSGSAEDADGEFVFHSFQHFSLQEDRLKLYGAGWGSRFLTLATKTRTPQEPALSMAEGRMHP